MIKKFEVHEQEGSYGYTDYQFVKDEHGNVEFGVHDLSDCPEDAIIGRCLFDANDWLNAVKYGMELAKQGYDEIEYVTIEDEEDEW